MKFEVIEASNELTKKDLGRLKSSGSGHCDHTDPEGCSSSLLGCCIIHFWCWESGSGCC
ncbi:hypothetical protein Mpet_2533 [Methanolacinia petrolearia DSM 11571]|uniref:Uncharacterized protein n=1 Tax=Methanolacinia petrolearia (strain DSM 11571 / OCM 486 / SEBR 4847) TaxID=679926 RepID=E1RF33_METP4|nr:hypothetical protein [Methanolacinia petrolearia]ADN37277.1 hypothetical protein Mpet_2533 [Methanolacinia petrolearia DSM 11571]